MGFDYTQENIPFESQQELLDQFSSMLDMHIYYIYKYHSWVGPDNSLANMMGVVVTREEFEHNLMKASDSTAYVALSPEEQEELERMRGCFESRMALTAEQGTDIPVIRLCQLFSCDRFESFVVATLLCCELDRKYEKLFTYLQDDVTQKRPAVQTLIRLWAAPLDFVSDYYGYFSESGNLLRYLCIGNSENRDSHGNRGSMTLALSRAVLDFITNSLPVGYERWRWQEPLHELYTSSALADMVVGAAGADTHGKTTVIFLVGRKGSGRKFICKHAAKELERDVLFLHAGELCDAESAERALYSAVCTCVLQECILCLTNFDLLLAEDMHAKLSELTRALNHGCEALGNVIFVTSEEKWQEAQLGPSIVKTDFEIPDTDEAQRLVLWESFMRDQIAEADVDPGEMAAKFRFNPGQIEAAVRRSVDLTRLSGRQAISAELLHQSCYDQVVVGLNTLASPIKPAYDWDDLVLPKAEVKLLKDACAHVKYRHTVYHTWGFSKKAAYGRGLSMLFAGPPGTGKTMAAQVVTNQLHMQMYKIQLSQIVSKYIGETEKNLRQVFTEAKNANCILFFDEMDALFGKRSEVKDSHDRHANIETAYLLQQMEEYDGVVLMATNLLQNIDEAFMRRINFVITFPFPDAPTRKRLWQKMLDTPAPKSEDIDYDFLAENFRIAGGNIKNCAVHAAFLAAAEDSEITMRHIVTSVVSEQRKNNVVVLREDLKEYADLVFGTT